MNPLLIAAATAGVLLVAAVCVAWAECPVRRRGSGAQAAPGSRGVGRERDGWRRCRGRTLSPPSRHVLAV